MKRRTSISMCALLGVMVAGLGQAATLRYIGTGNYNDIFAVTLTVGWPAGGGGPGGLPGPADLIRCNMTNNIVTLTNVAPTVLQFQLGVDESGQLVVESGGQLTAVGAAACKVGNNPSSAVIGQLIIKTNGVVNVSAVLHVGGGATGILTIDGGRLNQSNHLWVGSAAIGNGTVIVTNGGVLNLLGVGGNGMLGLGTGNATGPSGSTGTMKVTDGGVASLYNIDGTGRSIQPGSVLDISGSGVVTFPGDKTAALTTYYITSGKITAYGGTGTVAMDYNISNPGKTTLKAVGGYVAPTDVTWTPAAAPFGYGFWNEGTNWTGGLVPASVTKVAFDVVGAPPCTVTNAAVANCVVMGTNGPGGTLIVTNGGSLTCGSDNPSLIGYNSNALMIVENGGLASFGTELSIGLYPDSDATLLMNGGTVSVAGMFDLGYHGGKGTAQIKGGTLNLSQWDYFYSIQGASVLDITRTGKVVINGDQQGSVINYIYYGQITNSEGTGLLVDYNIINLGKTTIYPVGLNLAPAQAFWVATNNFPDITGAWNASTNWDVGMLPGDVTIVTFKVPDALPCVVSNAANARYVAMGFGGPGGTLIVTNGGSLTTGSDNWTAVGYNSNALMVVENGASVNLGYHLWVGLDPGSDGTFIMNGGTVSVAGMFGLGWQGGKGTAQINGGTLNLGQWHPTDSIKTNGSVLNLTATGTVVITGNYVSSISNFVSTGKITANGGPNVAYSFDSGANKTTLQVAPPRQSVTSASVSGGNATVTCQTTAGHLYHIESTPSLSPAVWTRVAGTTTNAPGAAVTFTFSAGSGQAFYRTVSP